MSCSNHKLTVVLMDEGVAVVVAIWGALSFEIKTDFFI